MLTLPRSVQIFLATEPADMRRSIDGLAALVEKTFGQDVYSGFLFVFLGKRRDRVKILTFDRGGFVLYYKRLEQGRFQQPRVDETGKSVVLDATQLMMLLDGIDVSIVKRSRAWQPPAERAAARPSTAMR